MCQRHESVKVSYPPNGGDQSCIPLQAAQQPDPLPYLCKINFRVPTRTRPQRLFKLEYVRSGLFKVSCKHGIECFADNLAFIKRVAVDP